MIGSPVDQRQGTLVRVSGEFELFELSEFELSRFSCIREFDRPNLFPGSSQGNKKEIPGSEDDSDQS